MQTGLSIWVRKEGRLEEVSFLKGALKNLLNALDHLPEGALQGFSIKPESNPINYNQYF
jgi:hypothetical protein